MPSATQTLYDVLQESARLHPDRVALSMVDGHPITYRDLSRRVRALSRFLHERQIGPGDRVAILSENMPQWGIAYFAVTTMGAVAVPILPDFHASDVERIVRHAESRAMFVSRRLREKITALAPAERGVTVLLDDFTLLPDNLPDTDDGEAEHRAAVGYAAEEDGQGDAPHLPAPADLAEIVYTSGTTGHSKGVMLTHSNLVEEARATIQIAGVGKDDRLLSVLPLPHTYECTLGLITPLMVGASVSYMDKPPTAAVLLPALQKIRPTIMLSVPLIIEKIYKGKNLPELTSKPLLRKALLVPALRKLLHRIAGKKLLATFGGKLRLFPIGGAPLAPDVEMFLREARFPYAIGYGLTETSPLVAGTGSEGTRYRSTGVPLPGTSIRIADPNPETGEGEIQVKGPTVMQGYYRDPVRTAESFTGDGWLKTGDLGVFDADGYLYIKGRLKNMILGPSGKNIYPEEIEAIINEFDTVRESVVFEHENRLVALVHPDYERLQRLLHTLNETDVRARINEVFQELHARINARVPLSARIHKIIEQAEPFQKTATQKIIRHLYIPRSRPG